jgi:murein peptide amidase A
VKGREMHSKWTLALRVGALLAAMGLAGCYEPVDFPEIVSPSEYEPTVVPAYYDIIGKSVQGYPLLCQVLGRGPDVTCVMATIHGDETAGTPLVRRLGRYLQAHPDLLDGRTVVLLPVTNPDGMAHKSRYNAHGVDLNRNFDAPNRVVNEHSGRTALSEPESRAIRRLILEYKPDRIVSIHQPLTCIDYDGPAGPLAAQMARYCDLRVKKIGARPGSLGSYAGVTLGIPIVTFEMPASASKLDPQAVWNGYGNALVAAVVYPDRVEPELRQAQSSFSAGK